MNRYRIIEAFVKIVLWIGTITIGIMYAAGFFEPLPDRLKTLIISAGISTAVILLWFMPSSMAERRLKKGLAYLDRNNEKSARYIEGYLNSKILADSERKNAMRILGVVHHKRGDDDKAINYLNQALEANSADNELKVEILGAKGIIYSEMGEYQKAADCFDRTFEILFAISKADIDKGILLQVVNTYIKAGQREKAVLLYDRLMMIHKFKRDKRVEEALEIHR